MAADLTVDIADESGGPACRTTAKGWRTRVDWGQEGEKQSPRLQYQAERGTERCLCPA